MMLDETVIPPSEAAIVTINDGAGLSLLLPNFEDGDTVPELMLALTACFVRLEKDPAFKAEQLAWMEAERAGGVQ